MQDRRDDFVEQCVLYMLTAETMEQCVLYNVMLKARTSEGVLLATVKGVVWVRTQPMGDRNNKT